MNNVSEPLQKVLVIDDEPPMRTLLEEILGDEFHVVTCESAKDGMQCLHLNKPDLILLDVNLKDSNGLETAKLIKHDPENKDIPIIFISGLSSQADKKEGYETGACDFIGKPFSVQEILHKVRLNISFNSKIREQNKIIDETRQMAFTAMAQSGEIGQILHFMRDSFECDTYEKLGNRILETMEAQQLNTAILFKTDPPIYFSHEGEIARLDKEILERLSILERIIDFGKRSLYNFENISLLVKNMPLDDDGLYGRIKDNVCLVLEAADAKVVGIKSEHALSQRDQSLSKIIKTSKQTLHEIEAAFQDNAVKNAAIMAALKEKIEWSFVQLGLSDEQEEEIANIVHEAENNSSALYESGLKIEDRLIQLTKVLNKITNPKDAK